MQTLSPMADCSVTDALIKTAPFINQSFLQMVDVTNLATIHSFLQNAPDRLVNQAVWWPVYVLLVLHSMRYINSRLTHILEMQRSEYKVSNKTQLQVNKSVK